jgi:hypothetical protein
MNKCYFNIVIIDTGLLLNNKYAVTEENYMELDGFDNNCLRQKSLM